MFRRGLNVLSTAGAALLVFCSMTKPLDPYSDTTLTMTNKLIDMKSRGVKLSELPSDQRPFDLKKVRNQFIKDVINYRTINDYVRLRS
jgi:hypothetical protein